MYVIVHNATVLCSMLSGAMFFVKSCEFLLCLCALTSATFMCLLCGCQDSTGLYCQSSSIEYTELY